MRDLVGELFEVRRQANTDTAAPYLAALSLDPPRARSRRRRPRRPTPTRPGCRRRVRPIPGGAGRTGPVDFDEQIYRAIEILLTDPDARAAAQARCRRLLVDEFQDLTPAHLLLIRLLAAPGFDCFGVGDDDQVIYGYSGATPEFLIDFAGYFPGAADHPLEVNYRCPPAVVDAARHLLSYNRERVAKTIRSPEGRTDPVPPSGGPLAGTGPGRGRDGARPTRWPAWPSTSSTPGVPTGSTPADIAVLARVNAALLPVQVACLESGVPCTTPLTTQVLGRTGIRTAFAYLRIGSDPGAIRREDVRDTIRRPSRGIAPMVVDMVTKNRTTSVADIRRLAGRLSGRDVPKLAGVRRRPRGGGRGGRPVDRRRAAGGPGRHRPRRHPGHPRRLAGRQPTARPTPTTWPRSSRSPPFHPDAATFAHWLREVLSRPAADGPGGRAVDGPPDQGQGVGPRAGGGRHRPGCSPTG